MAIGKKTGGRQKGTPNRVTVETRRVEEELATAGKQRANALFDDAYWANLKTRVHDGTAPHMETLFQHYLHGKPKETIEHQVPMRPVVIDLLQPGESLKTDD
jgi:hypothetical protein